MDPFYNSYAEQQQLMEMGADPFLTMADPALAGDMMALQMLEEEQKRQEKLRKERIQKENKKIFEWEKNFGKYVLLNTKGFQIIKTFNNIDREQKLKFVNNGIQLNNLPYKQEEYLEDFRKKFGNTKYLFYVGKIDDSITQIGGWGGTQLPPIGDPQRNVYMDKHGDFYLNMVFWTGISQSCYFIRDENKNPRYIDDENYPKEVRDFTIEFNKLVEESELLISSNVIMNFNKNIYKINSSTFNNKINEFKSYLDGFKNLLSKLKNTETNKDLINNIKEKVNEYIEMLNNFIEIFKISNEIEKLTLNSVNSVNVNQKKKKFDIYKKKIHELKNKHSEYELQEPRIYLFGFENQNGGKKIKNKKTNKQKNKEIKIKKPKCKKKSIQELTKKIIKNLEVHINKLKVKNKKTKCKKK